ncbi:hypothetical protein FACS1894219_08470 [Clostridia bacterium]|nr:hypothetical protein FACS1894219_08470 [Clostridia bacterium]
MFNKLIDRNTTIPVKKSQVYSTAADSQTSVEIHVLQGEREMASGNTTLGKFTLDGIPPAPRGVPQIEVTFDIDANGIVNVFAKDKGTGKEQHVTITSSTNMNKDAIDRAVKDAEKFAEEDKKLREKIDTKNNAENIIFQSEKTLADIGDKVTEDEKAPVKEKIEALKAVVNSDDSDSIKAATEELQKVFYALSAKLYQTENKDPNDNSQFAGGNFTPEDDGPIETNFKDDENK